MSKRIRSSSLGDVGLFSAVRPVDSHPARLGKKRPPPAPADQPSEPEGHRWSNFTIGSPVGEPNGEDAADEGFGAFLESCYFCRRKISEKKDIYMCGYLRAFCSLDCRDVQIAYDEKDKQTSPRTSQQMRESILSKGLECMNASFLRRGFRIPKFK